MKINTILIIIFASCYCASAQKQNSPAVASERAEKATVILKQFAAIGSKSVPLEVLRKAKAVGVFNDVLEFSLLMSKGTRGKGIVSLLDGNSWSLPVFLDFGSSSFDFKIAGKKNFDIVFFLMDDATVNLLKKDGIKPNKIKGKKLAAGPVVSGKGADLVLQNASLIYYTFKDGQIYGQEFQNDAFFNAIAIGLDNNLNKVVYGKKAKELLVPNQESVKVPAAIENFRQTVKDISTLSN